MREPVEWGTPGLIVFADLNRNGLLDHGEPGTTAVAGGGYSLTNVPAGRQVICQIVPPGRERTTPRCQEVTVPAGGIVGDVTFAARPVQCGNGTVTNTIWAIDLAGGDATYYRPTGVSGPAPEPWTGSRLRIKPPKNDPITFVQPGERLLNALFVSGVNTAEHPNLTLRYSYQRKFQQVVSVTLADGTPATYLGRGKKRPNPLPTGFSYFDANGELYIFNVPQDGAGGYRDVYVTTEVIRSSRSFTTSAKIGGKIVDNRLRAIPNTCRDKASSTIFTGPTGPR